MSGIMDKNYEELKVSDINKKLAATGKWDEKVAWLAERANYMCEYCGLDFFSSVANYKGLQVDHIVPVSKNGDPTSLENMAIACKTCNVDLKSRWNPKERSNSNNREELMDVVRKYIDSCFPLCR